MTDNEIIKALECCSKGYGGCEGCPYDDDCVTISGENLFAKDAIDLINRLKGESNKYRNKARAQKDELSRLYEENNRQKAEIERKTTQLERLEIYMDELVRQRLNSAKSEVIKELAERVNQCKEINPDSMDGELIIYAQDFDNLAKELVREEDEGNG